MARTWVAYDNIVTAGTSPGPEYVEWPDLRVTGPDADGLLWIQAEAPDGTKGAVSVRADSLAGRAFAACATETVPYPSTPAGENDR